jgi:hypothetical protein
MVDFDTTFFCFFDLLLIRMCDGLCLECSDILQGTNIFLSFTLQEEGGEVKRDLLLFSFSACACACACAADCAADIVDC